MNELTLSYPTAIDVSVTDQPSAIFSSACFVNGNLGLVCTIQRVSVVLKKGDAKCLMVRETDCFEKRNNEWKLIHQHASVPSGGDWDGKVATA
jgi:ketosteroid isomerase-like protein